MILIFLFMLAICAIGVFIGFDLRNTASWFYILCGFMMGFALGLTRNDWRDGVGIGIASAILVAFAGTMVFRQKQIFGGRNQEKDDHKNNRKSHQNK